MIDVDEAQRILNEQVRPGPTVRSPLREAAFRTLAEPVRCDVDYPPFDRALMDGFAVRSVDIRNLPATLRIAGRIAAGATAECELHNGEAVQINTGAPIPPGADAVVRVEDTVSDAPDNVVRILVAAPPGQFITRRGMYVKAGQVVLQAGERMTPVAIGAAASAGASVVTVYRRPTVAILSTGDELIDIDKPPTGAMIRNSNEYLMEALVRSARAEPVRLGIARDEPEGLRERITAGLGQDVLCITGGVSMGACDFVPRILRELGASFHIHKMAIKPGRPTIFATTPGKKLVFALPGNPGSALVGFELLVRPALEMLEGRPGRAPWLRRAVLRGSIQQNGARRAYLPAIAKVVEVGEFEVEPLRWQGSGDAFGMGRANALIVRPPQSGPVQTGGEVFLLLLDQT